MTDIFSELQSTLTPFADHAIATAMTPVFFVSSLLFYLLVSKRLFAVIRDKTGLQKDSTLLKLFVFVHNLSLAIFSLVVFVNVAPHMVAFTSTEGWQALHCDPTFWHSSFGWWCKVFYVSKYWEFIDSWILILKGKEASFLQVYHHTGIVIAMYFGTMYSSNWQIWLVMFK